MIDYCAPTLASLKTGNLFRIPCRCHEALETSLQQLRRKLEPKGVSLEVVHHYSKNVLVYVYRPVRLQQDLKQPGAAKLLRECGYEGTSVEQALAHLKKADRGGGWISPRDRFVFGVSIGRCDGIY